ncbi:MAG TPA: circadian clock KaiB family protein [Flavisolibacter sp.]|nr:circadian clock KaiB family protein [Flavisolibacter sp.]
MRKKEEDRNTIHTVPEKKTFEYVLRLYITGATPNSLRAVSNIKVICEAHLKGRYSLEVIDVYQQHAVAEQEQLIALPLLIKKQPLPERRMIGDLSNTEKVLKGLGLLS